MKFCEQCGSKVREISKFCPECGIALEGAQNATPKETPPVANHSPPPYHAPVNIPPPLPSTASQNQPIFSATPSNVDTQTNKSPLDVICTIFGSLHVIGLALLVIGFLFVVYKSSIDITEQVKNASLPNTSISHVETFFDEILSDPSWSQTKIDSKNYQVTVRGYNYIYMEVLTFTFDYNTTRKETSLSSIKRANGEVFSGILADIVMTVLGVYD